ncbi:thiamine pyrophosphate-binding protein [Burkholderia multivorans]|uniref:thiamine pyrophosphate-binding protein n=1 Tax=Burkholderia multivorans TaxID=87883 RepID=UPI0021BE379E|nr:thiamine pyrophosphate-binding protein [Burkholderia multivorans]
MSLPATERPGDDVVSAADEGASVGRIVGRELVDAGIRDMFCIPGDFTMQLSREWLAVSGLSLRTLSHEYGVMLAAIGNALAAGRPAAACFTYGVGLMNAANGIAQAYVERVPVVVISGAPGTHERGDHVFPHHTIVDHGTQSRVMRELTVHQEIVTDPRDAAVQVARAVAVARDASRPVYVEVPRDLYSVEVPYRPAHREAVRTAGGTPAERAAARAAARAALALSGAARAPVFVPGLEIKRFGLVGEVRALVERLALDWVASPMSRQVLDPTVSGYRGVYAGPASPSAGTRECVETSDCLWVIGEPNSDVNMGVAGRVPADALIHAHDGRVSVAGERFAVGTAAFVDALIESVVVDGAAPVRTPRPASAVAQQGDPAPACARAAPLTPDAFVAAMRGYFERDPSRVLVADCGDAFFMSLGMEPHDVLTSSLYMSMGIGVPGAIGWQLGGAGRPVVLVGDGAFQMTGLELMHARRFGASPIVIVLNNRRWTSLSSHPDDAPLTTLPATDFMHMAAYLGVQGSRADTVADLERLLAWADTLDEPVLIDARFAPDARSTLCERFFGAVSAQYHLSPPRAQRAGGPNTEA